MNDSPALEEMRGIRLATDQVEVCRARSKIFAGVFGGTPEPTMVGRFEVRERLGAGGMGIVYRAYDPQLDRMVALKVLRADATLAPDGAARLVEEARAMAKLSHPNVITVYEAGTLEEQVFIAMALVEGSTLRSWLRAHSRSPAQIMNVLRTAGRGLAAAHDAGLVHRDFKPENVLVSHDGEVFVTDFGLARSFTAEESGGWRRTSSGVLATRMAGTPAYMPPEQLRGGLVDARSDQFAWCVTAFEALAGARPFDEATLQKVAVEPSFVPDPKTLPTATPRRVRAAIERGLSFDPDARFDSLAALLDAVRPPRRAWVPVSLGLGVAALGLGAAALAQRDHCPPRPEKLAEVWDTSTQAAAHEAFVATGMPYAQRAWTGVQTRADRFAERWVALEQRACRDEDLVLSRCLDRRREAFSAVTGLFVEADAGVVEHAISVLSALPPLSACSDATASVEPEADATLDGARASLLAGRYDEAAALVSDTMAAQTQGSRTWLDASTLQGEVALAKGDAESSTAAFERVLDHVSGEQGRLAAARAAVGLLEVQTTLAQTDFDAARVLARSARIAVAAAANPPRLRTRLEAANASTEIHAGNYDEGIALVETAQALLAELGDDTLLERADLMHIAATALFRKQQFHEAARLSEASLTILRGTLGSMHPRVGRALLVPGSIALVRGDVAEAELHYKEAAEIFAQTVGRAHADYATALVSVANCARERGDFAQARTLTARALKVFERVFPAAHMRVLGTRLNLASLEHGLGDLDAARSAYLDTLSVQRATLGEHYEVSITLANLARIEHERGDTKVAKAYAEDALAIRRNVFGDDHDRTLASHVLLAEIELRAGVDVRKTLSSIRARRERSLGLEHRQTIEVVVIQAKATLALGDPSDALRLGEQALALRVAANRPVAELDAARAVVAIAAEAAGQRARAREAAAAVTWDGGPLPSELRGWCTDCRAKLQAIAEREG